MKAFSWIKKNGDNYGINKDQIIIGGGSAGGILSTNLCYLDSDMNSGWNKDGLIAFINLWGSPDQGRFYAKLDKKDPPTILIHGKNDTVVPYQNCQWLSTKLRQANVKFEIFAIDNAGHTPIDHLDEIEVKISEFLYGILKRKE
jgi:acetyl esterase/lipase